MATAATAATAAAATTAATVAAATTAKTAATPPGRKSGNAPEGGKAWQQVHGDLNRTEPAFELPPNIIDKYHNNVLSIRDVMEYWVKHKE